ncbi:unnamed protein product [Rhizophagus irregularis]|nr:unnamed protein product [Rhizophagus irregularis]
MEEESSEDIQTSEFTHDDCNNIGNEMILSNENHHTLLYSGRKFESWEACENFIIMWAKQQGFRIIKDRVVRLEEDEIIDKENVDPLTPILRNLKKRSGKGRSLGTKRFKSSTDAPKPKSRNQRNCRKCGKVGQNCKEQEI